MIYLLDTNVFREVGKSSQQQHVNVGTWLDSVDDSELCISALTVRETYKGIENLRKKKPQQATELAHRVRVILDAFAGRILPIDRAVAQRWGEMLADNGKHVDDTGITATASVHQLILVTRNTTDFSGRGVTLLDPYKYPPEII